jgi:hypothetical protein
MACRADENSESAALPFMEETCQKKPNLSQKHETCQKRPNPSEKVKPVTKSQIRPKSLIFVTCFVTSSREII